MEENKNSAIQKVEDIANGVYEHKPEPIETESQRAKVREEQALKRAREKAEKQKERLLKMREVQKAREDKALLKQTKRQAEMDKKQMLDNKSKEERQTLKRLERQAKLEAKQNEKRERIRLKREKVIAKKQLKEQKEKNRSRRKDNRRGYGGWLAAVICLGISTIALATALTLTFLMPQEADLAMESVYSKSFYDTVEQVDNIDLNLSKVLASKDEGAIQTYLLDVAVNSELAESDLNQLPLQDESKFYTTKLINQIGDYAKYLNKKLINGQGISIEDRQNLLALYNANAELKQMLQNTMTKMPGDFSFSSLSEGGNGNLVIKNFNDLQNLSVEYPELIYDGPFSDGIDRVEVKGIKGREISRAEAQEVFMSLFNDYGIEKVQMVGETTANIPTYNIQAEKDGESIYAQISKQEGRLIMFAYAGSCNGVNYQREDAIESAQEFFEKMQVKGMKPVWVNLSNNVYTINFAYEQKDVIMYSDLIKVRVCAETNMVIGLEGSSYWTNHTNRVVQNPLLSSYQAKEKVSSDIAVESSRLCVVPVGNSAEKLCYEFYGQFNDSDYYVYIDAMTGRQVEMFKVIESTEGTLLM
ncbi:MAG: germination protein YpeB [Clostridia bacterium]|nr:germination protein YpeB [Clostridia bacterium]